MRLAVLILVLLPLLGWSQNNQAKIITEMQQFYQENSMWNDKSLTFQPDTRTLQLSGYQITIDSNTILKAEKSQVSFYCQNGTAITHAEKPGEAKAFLAVPFKTKNASKNFVKLLRNLQE